MTNIRKETIQNAYNTRIAASKPQNPLQKSKNIVLFKNQTTNEQDKKQAYLDYSEMILEKFDTDKDGKVSKEEFKQGNLKLNYEVKKQLYNEPKDNKNLIKRMLSHNYNIVSTILDTNSDGYISKEEYAMLVLMSDEQGGVPADGKFTIKDEEAAMYQMRMEQNNPAFLSRLKNNPFSSK